MEPTITHQAPRQRWDMIAALSQAGPSANARDGRGDGRESSTLAPSYLSNGPTKGEDWVWWWRRPGEVDLLEGYGRSVEAGEELRPGDHDTTRSLYRHDADGNGMEKYSDSTREWRKIRGDGRTVREPSASWTPGDPPRSGPAEAHNYHTDPEIRRVEDAVFHPKRRPAMPLWWRRTTRPCTGTTPWW